MLKRLTSRFWFCALIFWFLNPSPGRSAKHIQTFQGQINPQAFEYFVSGDLYELFQDFRSAIKEYQNAKDLQPDVPEIRYALAHAYYEVRDWESAKREALEIEPKDTRTYHLLGECYRALGERDSAIQAYSQAVKLDPTHLNSIWYLAVLWQQKQDFNNFRLAGMRKLSQNTKRCWILIPTTERHCLDWALAMRLWIHWIKP
jgi:tetratricopeptide (TPR) repeat protein